MSTFGNNINGYGSLRVKGNNSNNVAAFSQHSSSSSSSFSIGGAGATHVDDEPALSTNSSYILRTPLSFQNKTFSVANSHRPLLPTSASTSSFQTKQQKRTLNENNISNILLNRSSQQQPPPNPPTRTISLRPHDVRTAHTHQRVHSFNYPFVSTRTVAAECTEQDVLKVESCYKSFGTQVFACKAMADLYSTNLKNLLDLSEWTHECTGIPIFVFNTGLNPKRKKCLSFILADRLTGFALRKIDSVTHLNNFKWAKKNLITFKVTTNDEFNDIPPQSLLDRKRNQQTSKSSTSLKSLDKASKLSLTVNNDQCCSLYALEFKNDFECSRFYDYYRTIAFDNKNKDLFDSNYKPKKSDSVVRVFCRRITKAAISGPAMFQHINSVPNLLKMLKEEEMDSIQDDDDDDDEVNRFSNENYHNS